MTEIEVKVSGPGMCINSEVEIIRQALVTEGFVVEVTNPYPPSNETIKEHVDRIRTLGHAKRTMIHDYVNHYPWGG